jgi:hypothetical protein
VTSGGDDPPGHSGHGHRAHQGPAVCQQHETVLDRSTMTRTVHRCHLPAGHCSVEHWDRTAGPWIAGSAGVDDGQRTGDGTDGHGSSKPEHRRQ